MRLLPASCAAPHCHASHAPAASRSYASSSSRTDPSTYLNFFSEADGFIAEVQHVIELRDQLAPNVKLDVDECGVILPNDNDANAPQFPRIYWNAGAWRGRGCGGRHSRHHHCTMDCARRLACGCSGGD